MTTLPTSIDLSQYGLTNVTDIIYNPSYDVLFSEETNNTLTGFERGIETELNAINVDTGIFTGRSPKDKYIVRDEITRDTVWWADQGKNDNHPMNQKKWRS